MKRQEFYVFVSDTEPNEYIWQSRKPPDQISPIGYHLELWAIEYTSNFQFKVVLRETKNVEAVDQFANREFKARYYGYEP